MAREKKHKGGLDSETKVSMIPSVQKTKLTKPVENRVKFLVWFSDALGRFKELKPHHMSTVKTYFVNDLGLKEYDVSDAFDEGLKKFGFGRN